MFLKITKNKLDYTKPGMSLSLFTVQHMIFLFFSHTIQHDHSYNEIYYDHLKIPDKFSKSMSGAQASLTFNI